MKKCSVCGTIENVLEVKKIPLPDGKAGHITLTNWTNFCPPCMKEKSAKIYGFMLAKYELDPI